METAGVARGRWNSPFKVVLLALAAGAMNFACQGHIAVYGRVYQAVDPIEGKTSYALVDELDQVLPERLVPLAGAEVTVEPWRPEARAHRSDAAEGIFRAVSNVTGHFQTGGRTSPFKFDATLTVRREGFKTAQTIFVHDRLEHFAIVILGRDRDEPAGDLWD